MRPAFIACFCLLLLTVICPIGVSAYVVDIQSDAELVALLNEGRFTKQFGANIRWGNDAENGDWEYALVDSADFPIAPDNPGQLQWSAYQPAHGYAFTYDAAAHLASLSLTLETLADGQPYAAPVSAGAVGDTTVNALVIRAKAGGSDVAALDSPVQILFGNGDSLLLAGLSGDLDANAIMLVDDRLSAGFTVSGQAFLADGTGSLPMYQFKVGVSPVPIPGTAGLLGVGLFLFATIRKRTSAS